MARSVGAVSVFTKLHICHLGKTWEILFFFRERLMSLGIGLKGLGWILAAAVGVSAVFITSKSRGPCPYCGHTMFEAHPETAECYNCEVILHVDKLNEIRESPPPEGLEFPILRNKVQERQPE